MINFSIDKISESQRECMMKCHYLDKSSEHKHCSGGDIMFLVCHMTTREHMFKGLWEFMGGSLSR